MSIQREHVPVTLLLALLSVVIGACSNSPRPEKPPTDGQDLHGRKSDLAVAEEDGIGEAVGPELHSDYRHFPVAPDAWVSDETLAPRHLHFGLDSAPATTVVVQWAIDRAALDGYVPRVWWAPSDEVEPEAGSFRLPWNGNRVAEGECSAYKEELFDMPVSDVEYVMCRTRLSGLTPATRYYLRAGTWSGYEPVSGVFDAPNLSSVASFRTGLEKGSKETFVFFAGGDSRGGYGGLTANSVSFANIGADFWVFNGDFNDTGAQAEWDLWFGAMAPVLESTVFLTVIGNHEMFTNVYLEQFAQPHFEGIPESYRGLAWGMDYGNAHIIGLDSRTGANTEALVPWLTADLAAASKDPAIDWIIVNYHHGTYSSSNHGCTQYVLDDWVPLFDEYGVDLVLNGHDHNYERTWPIRDGKVVDEGGVIYVVAGAFFAPSYSNGNEWWTAISHHGNKQNYMVIEVSGDKLYAVAWNGEGTEVLDEFSLSK